MFVVDFRFVDLFQLIPGSSRDIARTLWMISQCWEGSDVIIFHMWVLLYQSAKRVDGLPRAAIPNDSKHLPGMF